MSNTLDGRILIEDPEVSALFAEIHQPKNRVRRKSRRIPPSFEGWDGIPFDTREHEREAAEALKKYRQRGFVIRARNNWCWVEFPKNRRNFPQLKPAELLKDTPQTIDSKKKLAKYKKAKDNRALRGVYLGGSGCKHCRPRVIEWQNVTKFAFTREVRAAYTRCSHCGLLYPKQVEYPGDELIRVQRIETHTGVPIGHRYFGNLVGSTNLFSKFMFPVMRRVFPNLIANEICSVQPMTAPVGAIFYPDYRYGSERPNDDQGPPL